jgi:hypothetical protein
MQHDDFERLRVRYVLVISSTRTECSDRRFDVGGRFSSIRATNYRQILCSTDFGVVGHSKR